jgi:hypothetical protein
MKNPIKYIKPFATKHEPEILMAMGIGGMIFSIAWGIKATFKAARAIDNYKETYGKEKLNAKEVIKLTWKQYLPVVISTVASVPCIIASNSVSNKRYAALATAYTVTETALQEYQDKVKEVVGDKKAKEIKEAVSGDKVEQTYQGGNQIVMTNNGTSLFFEPLSGRYFMSSWNDIAKAANELNAKALSGFSNFTSLNDWFQELGLESTDMGEEVGWNVMDGINNIIDISISSHVTKDNVPCGAISYNVRPSKIR